jgi:beta-phosphoglucomutase
VEQPSRRAPGVEVELLRFSSPTRAVCYHPVKVTSSIHIANGLALLFDLDGVIVDSNPMHELSWREYGRRLGLGMDDPLRESMYGKRNDEIVRDLLGNRLSEQEVFAHGAAKEALYREMMGPHLLEHLVPGVTEFLERHREMPIGLASNAERPNIDFVLDGAGLRRYFRAVIDGNQVKRAKPDPEVFLRAAASLGADPRNCIVFEDSFAGVAAARAAGAKIVGVTTTHAALPDVDLAIGDFRNESLEPWLSGLELQV